MNTIDRLSTNIALGLTCLVFFVACGGGSGSGEDDVDPARNPSTASFDGTFTGNVTFIRQGGESIRPMILDLDVGSALTGALALGDGTSGSIAGDATGNEATFVATLDEPCTGSFEGSMLLETSDAFSVHARGEDCNGPLELRADVTRLEAPGDCVGTDGVCIDMSGVFNATETVTVTCTAAGQSETDTQSGGGEIFIQQDGCRVSYAPPGLGVIRTGEISGCTVQFSGPFVVPLAGGVTFSENSTTISGSIIDENRIDLSGTGVAAGRVDGIDFSCSGTSSGQLVRSSPCDFSAEPGEPERCFGGVGSRCNGDAPGAPFVKHEDTCLVDGWMSTGSILHDRCCLASNNEGYSCSGLNRGDRRCYDEWQEAWFNTQCSILGFPRQWEVQFGPYPAGNSGDDTARAFRAPPNTRINPTYEHLCQSGRCRADHNGNTQLDFDGCGMFCFCE